MYDNNIISTQLILIWYASRLFQRIFFYKVIWIISSVQNNGLYGVRTI